MYKYIGNEKLFRAIIRASLYSELKLDKLRYTDLMAYLKLNGGEENETILNLIVDEVLELQNDLNEMAIKPRFIHPFGTYVELNSEYKLDTRYLTSHMGSELKPIAFKLNWILDYPALMNELDIRDITDEKIEFPVDRDTFSFDDELKFVDTVMTPIVIDEQLKLYDRLKSSKDKFLTKIPVKELLTPEEYDVIYNLVEGEDPVKVEKFIIDLCYKDGRCLGIQAELDHFDYIDYKWLVNSKAGIRDNPRGRSSEGFKYELPSGDTLIPPSILNSNTEDVIFKMIKSYMDLDKHNLRKEKDRFSLRRQFEILDNELNLSYEKILEVSNNYKDLKYISPLDEYKYSHSNLKDHIDFYKLANYVENDKIYGFKGRSLNNYYREPYITPNYNNSVDDINARIKNHDPEVVWRYFNVHLYLTILMHIEEFEFKDDNEIWDFIKDPIGFRTKIIERDKTGLMEKKIRYYELKEAITYSINISSRIRDSEKFYIHTDEKGIYKTYLNGSNTKLDNYLLHHFKVRGGEQNPNAISKDKDLNNTPEYKKFREYLDGEVTIFEILEDIVDPEIPLFRYIADIERDYSDISYYTNVSLSSRDTIPILLRLHSYQHGKEYDFAWSMKEYIEKANNDNWSWSNLIGYCVVRKSTSNEDELLERFRKTLPEFLLGNNPYNSIMEFNKIFIEKANNESKSKRNVIIKNLYQVYHENNIITLISPYVIFKLSNLYDINNNFTEELKYYFKKELKIRDLKEEFTR